MSIVLFYFSEHYCLSNILPKDSSKVRYTLKITVSKQFDNFAKRALRVTETGTSRIDSTTGPQIRLLNSVIFLPARPASQTHDSHKGRMILDHESPAGCI